MIGDFARAIGQLTDRRFTGVLVKSLLLTLSLLALLSVGAAGLVGLLPESFDLPLIGEVETPFLALRGLALGAMVWLSSFLMFPVAAMFVSLYLDQIADAVEARHYPHLPAAHRTGFLEDLKTGLGFMLVVIGVNLVGLVVYLLSGPLAPFVFWAVNGYLIGREYFQLAAQRRVAAAENRRLRRRHGWRIWLAGTLMAIPLSVPIVNLVMPLLGVASYVHMFHRLTGSTAPGARNDR
jgi:uncharacterized protein involved in cysteine biosynthesis